MSPAEHPEPLNPTMSLNQAIAQRDLQVLARKELAGAELGDDRPFASLAEMQAWVDEQIGPVRKHDDRPSLPFADFIHQFVGRMIGAVAMCLALSFVTTWLFLNLGSALTLLFFQVSFVVMPAFQELEATVSFEADDYHGLFDRTLLRMFLWAAGLGALWLFSPSIIHSIQPAA